MLVRGGSTAIGTARPDNHDYLRSLGGVPVEYGENMLDQIRTVAPVRLRKRLGALAAPTLAATLLVLTEMFAP